MTEWTKKETWGYDGKTFTVEVVKWQPKGYGIIWNKYLYLFRGNKHFGLYRPDRRSLYPSTPFGFHGGITYYHEHFDEKGRLSRQAFGDDYNHFRDRESPVNSEGKAVFEDAERLIKEVEA